MIDPGPFQAIYLERQNILENTRHQNFKKITKLREYTDTFVYNFMKWITIFDLALLAFRYAKDIPSINISHKWEVIEYLKSFSNFRGVLIPETTSNITSVFSGNNCTLPSHNSTPHLPIFHFENFFLSNNHLNCYQVFDLPA